MKHLVVDDMHFAYWPAHCGPYGNRDADFVASWHNTSILFAHLQGAHADTRFAVT